MMKRFGADSKTGDFWLHCASQGYWGTTLPEYLDWYRRRTNHNERWGTWDGGARQGRVSGHPAPALSAVVAGAVPRSPNRAADAV